MTVLVFIFAFGLILAVVLGVAFRKRSASPPTARGLPPTGTTSQPAAPPAEPPAPVPPEAPKPPKNHDPAYRLQIETSDISWNEAFYTVFGYSRDEPAGTLEWWTGHIYPDDAMLVNNAMNKLIEPSVREWDVAYRFRRGNQSFVRVNDHVLVERDKDGKAISIMGTLTLLPTHVQPVTPLKM